jgi:scyllo-inositol 2-dehydrogenase (NADP+)
MENKIKTALASYGMSGQVFHGPLLKVNPQFEVVNVLERSKTNSRKLFPETRIVKSYGELLNNNDIELVVVNTPDELHFEMIKQALEAGKHVIAEKPVTQMRNQAEELFNLAEKKGLLLTAFQNRRFDGDFLTVKKVLEQGMIGRLVEFESHYDRYRNFIDSDSWKEHGGDYSGVLYNLGSHMVDQVVVLFGRPKAVTAHLKIVRSGGNVNDYYDIRLEYESFAAILKCSYLVKNPGPRYSLHGDTGTFHKMGIDPQEELMKKGVLPQGSSWGSDDEKNWGRLVFEKNELNYSSLIETLPGNYPLFYDNIHNVLRKKATPHVKPHEVLSVLEILEACLKSNKEKRTVYLD